MRGEKMENTKRSLYIKLNSIIDAEIEKGIDLMDCDLIEECVDGILRLKDEKSYQITAQQREENIQRILSNIPQKKKLSKVAKILLAAAIIMILLIGSVFAYTIIEYNIHDYGTYSEVWANITSKKIDKPVEVGYVPDGYELVEEEFIDGISYRVYQKSDEYLTIRKSTFKNIEINTEYGKSRIKTINNEEYLFHGGEDGHSTGVFWVKNNFSFSIVSYLDDDELLKIAQSVS